MGSRIAFVAGAGAIAVVGGAICWFQLNAHPRAQIDASRELRIVHVSFGTVHQFSTEPSWKRALRRVVPDRWERFLGRGQAEQRLTSHESLVVWTRELDANGRVAAPGTLDQAYAVLPDGNLAPAISNSSRDGVRLTFNSFARGTDQVPLRLHFGSKVVELKVRNPNRGRRAHWRTLPLPQTNAVFDSTRVVLDNVSAVRQFGNACSVRLYALGAENVKVGWIAWRVAVFDPWGNWAGDTGSGSTFPRVMPAFATNETAWKIQARGVEYLSAGYVDVPATAEYRVLAVTERASQLGVRSVVWLGPGMYQITVPGEVVRLDVPPQKPDAVERDGADRWTVRCAEPSALCISENGAPQLRVRERVDSRGRVFRTIRITRPRAPSGVSSSLFAELFTPQLPGDPKNLEVEIMMNLPPTDFFIAAPFSK